LLAEAEQLPFAPTRPQHYVQQPADHAVANSSDPLEVSWERLELAMNSGEQIEVEVTGCNRGGLIAIYNGVRGFITRLFLTA